MISFLTTFFKKLNYSVEKINTSKPNTLLESKEILTKEGKLDYESLFKIIEGKNTRLKNVYLNFIESDIPEIAYTLTGYKEDIETLNVHFDKNMSTLTLERKNSDQSEKFTVRNIKISKFCQIGNFTNNQKIENHTMTLTLTIPVLQATTLTSNNQTTWFITFPKHDKSKKIPYRFFEFNNLGQSTLNFETPIHGKILTLSSKNQSSAYFKFPVVIEKEVFLRTKDQSSISIEHIESFNTTFSSENQSTITVESVNSPIIRGSLRNQSTIKIKKIPEYIERLNFETKNQSTLKIQKPNSVSKEIYQHLDQSSIKFT